MCLKSVSEKLSKRLCENALLGLVVAAAADVAPLRHQRPEVPRLLVLQGHVAVAKDQNEARVVVLQHRMDEITHRVSIEVRGDVAHAQRPAKASRLPLHLQTD